MIISEIQSKRASSYIGSLLVSILWYCILFPTFMNVQPFLGGGLKWSLLILYILEIEKIFLKYHSHPQLILLHVCVISYFT